MMTAALDYFLAVQHVRLGEDAASRIPGVAVFWLKGTCAL
jgi:hypothetical protein